MYKSCSRCGKIHDTNYVCKVNKVYKNYNDMGEEREQRNTNDWHTKSKQIRERANYLCEYCRSKRIYVYDGLEVHHIIKVRDDSTGLLNDLNLVCLCTKCHKLAEAGIITAEELRELAAVRERGG